MKKILILGAAGFIGTNLAKKLMVDNHLVLFDIPNAKYLITNPNCEYISGYFDGGLDFDSLTMGIDVVYHLISTVIPSTSNANIAEGFNANVINTIKLLDSCVKNKVKKVVFISSGGTVYGKTNIIPTPEEAPTYPISAYGIEKLTIEKLLHLYYYLYKLDYLVLRLANPYGPYQNPKGKLGVLTTFIYKYMKNEPISVFGNGEVVRDYIFIDDVIDIIFKLDSLNLNDKTYNISCSNGLSINQLISILNSVFGKEELVIHTPCRASDVPINVLDCHKLLSIIGNYQFTDIRTGILKTYSFLKENGD
jgi:UDP-glucose 4-epimerase